MEFKKLNAPSLRELFVNELQNMILSGKLEIGSKLPPERELAESMKVLLYFMGEPMRPNRSMCPKETITR